MAQFLINDLETLHTTIKELCTHNRLSHDTETFGPDDVGGLYPFHGSRAFSHIFATEENEYYFNFNPDSNGMPLEAKSLLQPIFDDPNRIIFYCNAVYDAPISYFDNLTFKQRVVDCPAIARIEFNRHGRQQYAEESFLSLAYLAQYYGVQLKDDRVKEYIIQNNLYSPKLSRFTNEKIPLYNKVPLDLMFEYGCADARSTFDLGTKIIRCINYKDSKYDHDTKMINVAKNEIRLTSVLIDLKIAGMHIDREYVEKQIEIDTQTTQNLTGEVREIVGDMNINSGVQLAEFLVEKGIEVPRKDPTETALLRAKAWKEKAELAKSKNPKKYDEYLNKANEYEKGNYITDKKTLAKILAKNPHLDFLSKITKIKEAEKKINTYYKNFLLLSDHKGIIHASLNQEKAITGRFSSTDPNLQNTPKKDKSIKRAFITGDPNYSFLCVDFDQCEMMVMLDQSGEMSVINQLLDGIFADFYLACAHVLKEVTGLEIDRQTAKAIALGLAYGQGDELLATNLGLSVEQAKDFKAKFFIALPKLAVFNTRLKNTIRLHGKIHNPFGRVLYFNSGEEYKGLNAFIQSTSADITKLAMVNIHEYLKPFKTKMLLSVHDELIFRLHKDEHHLIPEIQRLMSEAYTHKHIALGTGVELSNTNWGDKEEYKYAG